jgi:hypothetical protein
MVTIDWAGLGAMVWMIVKAAGGAVAVGLVLAAGASFAKTGRLW